MLGAFFIYGAGGDLFSQAFTLASRQHTFFDVLVLTLALCARPTIYARAACGDPLHQRLRSSFSRNNCARGLNPAKCVKR